VGEPLKVAVVFVHLGPYHRARLAGLATQPGVSASAIELASSQHLYPWVDHHRPTTPAITLFEGPFEDSNQRAITRELLATLDALRPDAVAIAGYHIPALRAAARWAGRTGRARVLMFESTELDKPRNVFVEASKGYVVRHYFDTAFVGGSASAAYLAKLGFAFSRIWQGYDVVDNSRFAKRAAEARADSELLSDLAPTGRHYFVTAARFAPEKNLDGLLEAYAIYRDHEPDGWGLVLAGDGPLDVSLRARVAELGLRDVCFPGFLDPDRLAVVMGRAGAFVLPSLSEPWGLVVNEAMACGLPVIVTNRAGSAFDLVREGENGWRVQAGSVDSLARALLEVARATPEERARMGEFSRRAIEAYSPEGWGRALTAAARAAVALRSDARRGGDRILSGGGGQAVRS
jgi:1,2-diacylglycerol 3-alpha-glucosyltransferase